MGNHPFKRLADSTLNRGYPQDVKAGIALTYKDRKSDDIEDPSMMSYQDALDSLVSFLQHRPSGCNIATSSKEGLNIPREHVESDVLAPVLYQVLARQETDPGKLNLNGYEAAITSSLWTKKANEAHKANDPPAAKKTPDYYLPEACGTLATLSFAIPGPAGVVASAVFGIFETATQEYRDNNIPKKSYDQACNDERGFSETLEANITAHIEKDEYHKAISDIQSSVNKLKADMDALVKHTKTTNIANGQTITYPVGADLDRTQVLSIFGKAFEIVNSPEWDKIVSPNENFTIDMKLSDPVMFRYASYSSFLYCVPILRAAMAFYINLYALPNDAFKGSWDGRVQEGLFHKEFDFEHALSKSEEHKDLKESLPCSEKEAIDQFLMFSNPTLSNMKRLEDNVEIWNAICDRLLNIVFTTQASAERNNRLYLAGDASAGLVWVESGDKAKIYKEVSSLPEFKGRYQAVLLDNLLCDEFAVDSYKYFHTTGSFEMGREVYNPEHVSTTMSGGLKKEKLVEHRTEEVVFPIKKDTGATASSLFDVFWCPADPKPNGGVNGSHPYEPYLHMKAKDVNNKILEEMLCTEAYRNTVGYLGMVLSLYMGAYQVFSIDNNSTNNLCQADRIREEMISMHAAYVPLLDLFD